MQKEKRIPNNPTPEESVILSSLASELFQKAPEFPEVTDWDAVLSESINQAVFPLVFNPVRDRLPDELKRKWEPIFLQNAATDIRVAAAHTDLHRVLSEHDIPYVMLKGVASSRYYPHPELRMMGDVDFLVAPDDLERCGELLERYGMRRIDDGAHEFHRAYFFRSNEYEMHWSPPGVPAANGEKIRDCFKDIFEEKKLIKISSGNCYVPSDYHHGLILLLHTAIHLTTTGIGLRHLCDWAVFVEHFTEEGFCKCFEACLKNIGLWDFTKALTMTCVHFLGGSNKAWAADVSEDLLNSLMEDTWSGGNFGSKDPQRTAYRMLMIDSGTHKIVKRGVISALAMAIHSKAKAHYPRLAGSYVFLPAAWAAVSWKYCWQVLTKKRPWVRGGKDANAAKRRRELFDQLKLFEN